MDHALTLGWYVVPVVIVAITAFLCSLYFFFAYLIAKSTGDDFAKPARYAMVSLVVMFFAFLWPLMLIGVCFIPVFLMVRDMFTKKEN